jgi:hypothetical protein
LLIVLAGTPVCLANPLMVSERFIRMRRSRSPSDIASMLRRGVAGPALLRRGDLEAMGDRIKICLGLHDILEERLAGQSRFAVEESAATGTAELPQDRFGRPRIGNSADAQHR